MKAFIICVLVALACVVVLASVNQEEKSEFSRRDVFGPQFPNLDAGDDDDGNPKGVAFLSAMANLYNAASQRDTNVQDISTLLGSVVSK
jgi:hypothetical protein